MIAWSPIWDNIMKVQEKYDEQSGNDGDDNNTPRYVIREILSKRIRNKLIEYYVVFDEITPKPSCWVPFTTLSQVTDAVALYEQSVGQAKYKTDIVHQLNTQVVEPIMDSLDSMKVNKPIIKVRKSRKTIKQLQREYKLEKIKRENHDSIVVDPEPPTRVRLTDSSSVEVISLDRSFDDVDKNEIEKLVKCLKNKQEKKLYFMVQYKENQLTGVRKYPDIFSTDQMMKLQPKLLADYLLKNYTL